MSDGDQRNESRDAARAKSRNCPYCSGEGMTEVFDPDYTGMRVVERDAIHRGELKRIRFAMVTAAHCACPMGEWLRNRTDDDLRSRIPNMLDVLAGRGRWLAHDPTWTDIEPVPGLSAREMMRRAVVNVGNRR